MKKMLFGLSIALIAVGFFSIKYFTTLLDSKGSAIIVNKSYVLEGNMGESEGGLQASSNPKKPYPSETAIENGDVVNIHGRISNLDKFDNFMKNIESGNKDRIRITSYTVEGDPIFYNLVYDGSQIQYSYDNSQDEFAGSDRGIKSTSCSDLVSKNTENGVVYNLSGCSSEVGNTFNFWSQN